MDAESRHGVPLLVPREDLGLGAVADASFNPSGAGPAGDHPTPSLLTGLRRSGNGGEADGVRCFSVATGYGLRCTSICHQEKAPAAASTKLGQRKRPVAVFGPVIGPTSCASAASRASEARGGEGC